MKTLLMLMLAACMASAQNVPPSDFAPLGRIGMGGWPAWDMTPYPLSQAGRALRSFGRDPDATLSYSDGPAHGKGGGAFASGVLLPDGRVVLVPFHSSVVGVLGGSQKVDDNAALSPFFNKL
jgi:hypothetical protein